jgi:DNA repair ATPase RecN
MNMSNITIANKKLRQYLQEKDALVKSGRKESEKIEKIEKRIEELKIDQRKYTEACNPALLIKKGDELRDKINADINKLEQIGNQVQEIKIEAIPKEIKFEYEKLKKEKADLELSRNKIALKVQKIKDRSIPIIQKEVQPFLKEEFDDIQGAEVKGDVIIVTTFNHLEEWKTAFRNKIQKK